ncbi:MAG: hypothetical protein JXA87_11580 [Thermoleophilia bacterium]|nr:hypothetical protein [Thermoleophilia bacterium]
MARARLQLTAQSMGLAVQPLSQMLEEYPEVGRSTKDVPRSMRRDAADLVIE